MEMGKQQVKATDLTDSKSTGSKLSLNITHVLPIFKSLKSLTPAPNLQTLSYIGWGLFY